MIARHVQRYRNRIHRSFLLSSSNAEELHTQASIVGAGLAGSLLAVYLRRRGYRVDVFEKLSDMRKCTEGGGRSINLVLTSRGLHALNQVGLKERIQEITVPVYGRALHSMDGEVAIQKYGPDSTHFNLSVSRSELNKALMTAAEEAGAKIHFDVDLNDFDLESCTFTMTSDNSREKVVADHIFGVDGANSSIRTEIISLAINSQNDVIPLGTSYKELSLGLLEDGTEPLRTDMLHIWPRGSHFMMGLANQDGSMTMTLYLPDKGEISVEALSESKIKVRDYFETFYPDVIPMMPNYLDEYHSNPDGFLGTLRCRPWHWKGNAVLLGDACHAITPFFGQGCNCSFEDVVSLDQHMGAKGVMVPKSEMKKVFECTFFIFSNTHTHTHTHTYIHTNQQRTIWIENRTETRSRILL